MCIVCDTFAGFGLDVRIRFLVIPTPETFRDVAWIFHVFYLEFFLIIFKIKFTLRLFFKYNQQKVVWVLSTLLHVPGNGFLNGFGGVGSLQIKVLGFAELFVHISAVDTVAGRAVIFRGPSDFTTPFVIGFHSLVFVAFDTQLDQMITSAIWTICRDTKKTWLDFFQICILCQQQVKLAKTLV